ncbi:MAG: AAA family ATPase, partial [Desulfobacteraceae bacterium]|nr:AAA family ATPase [Desulfobacteraceae bacterium]
KRDYIGALEAKQEKYSLEHEFGVRAFIGAGRVVRRKDTGGASEIQALGRREDLDRIIKKIRRSDCRLLIVHGLSGVGKSSILEAGAEPALKKMSIETRCVVSVITRSYTVWAETLLQNICIAVKPPQPRSHALRGNADRTLRVPECRECRVSTPGRGASGLHSHAERGNEVGGAQVILEKLRENDRNNLLTVLIFDQFEEFFFANPDPIKRRIFYDFLDDCLDIPYTKVILSLRQDYLHYLLNIPLYVEKRRRSTGKVDTIPVMDDILCKNIRHGLENFSRDQAKAVVETLSERSRFRPDPLLIERMVSDLAGETGEVRPIELQIVGSQLETENITRLDQYKSRKELVQGFLDDVIHDCGKENNEAALLLLYLLTDENNTRPLKTLAELNGDIAGYETADESDSEQAGLILDILTRTGVVIQIPEEPEDRYQVVHDYIAELIRENSKTLLRELEDRRAEKKLQNRLEKQKQERQRRQLKIAVAAGFVFAVLAILAVWFGIQSAKDRGRAEGQRIIAEQRRGDAEKQTKIANEQREKAKKAEQESNYNLARVFEEKAGFALNQALQTSHPDDFQKAWLFTLAALKQDVGNRILPVSVRRLQDTALRKGILPWLWSSRDMVRHFGFVNSVSFSPDGKLLAAGAGSIFKGDSTVRLWDVETGKTVTEFRGHSGSVRSISVRPDGRLLASGSYDTTVRQWDVENGKTVTEFPGHSGSVLSISFSPDVELLTTGSSDDTVLLRDVETG